MKGPTWGWGNYFHKMTWKSLCSSFEKRAWTCLGVGEDHGRWDLFRTQGGMEKPKGDNPRQNKECALLSVNSKSMLTTSVLLPSAGRTRSERHSAAAIRCPGLSCSPRIPGPAPRWRSCPLPGAGEAESPRQAAPLNPPGAAAGTGKSHQLAGNFFAGNDWAFCSFPSTPGHTASNKLLPQLSQVLSGASWPAETRPRAGTSALDPRRRPGRGGRWRGSAGAGRPGATMLCFPAQGPQAALPHQTSPARRNSRGSCRGTEGEGTVWHGTSFDAFPPHRPLLFLLVG